MGAKRTERGLGAGLPKKQVNVLSQPGEPADWVKKQARLLEREMDDGVKEMVKEMKRRHLWTRKITHPSTPPRYDPNEPPINPLGFLDNTDDDLDDSIFE